MVVAGAAVGGLTVALLGARPALGFDAATFVVSALLIKFGVLARPAAATSVPSALRQLGGGVRVVFGDRALRILLMLGWLAAFYEIPGGIAAPYAARLGGGPVAAGLLIAATQLGAAVATPVFAKRIGPLTRLKWMGPMAACACGTLMLTAFRPGLAASMAIFALSGCFAMYQIAANTAFVERVPSDRRAQAFGFANAGLVAGQGAAFALAGAAAEVVPPSTVIAVGGGLGALAACGLSPSLAGDITRRGAPLREASQPSSLAYQANTRPCGSFSLIGQSAASLARARVRPGLSRRVRSSWHCVMRLSPVENTGRLQTQVLVRSRRAVSMRFLPPDSPFCPRDGYPVPVEHLREPGPSRYRWMRVAVAGRQGFRVQPEDRAELGAVDAGVADESKQFRMFLE